MKKYNKKNKPSWNQLLSAEAEAELKQVGAYLSEARKRRQMSVSKLAERIGVDRRTLSQVEKGNPTVSLGVFFQTLSTLNMLKGIVEVVRPENDVTSLSDNIRRVRKRLTPHKAIKDSKVDF